MRARSPVRSLRSTMLLAAATLVFVPALARAQDGGVADGDAGIAGAPPLPPPVGDTAPATTTTETAPAGGLSAEDFARLKAQLKAEIEAEMKADLSTEVEAASKESATQKAAAREWEEERWVEEVKPTLNFLEIDGYFRSRFDFFNRLDFGTYDPVVGRGTSGFPPPTLYLPYNGEECIVAEGEQFGENPAAPGYPCQVTADDSATILTTNMRLRVDPTFNVSDDIRVRSTVDVFDNLVFGSTPESLPGFANNPTLPLPLFASSQNAPQAGLNSLFDAVRVKRLWAEVMTPFGQLRVGRQPQQFGLGLLANDGNKIDDDYGDNADMVLFATRVAGHYIVPAYSISSAGPVGRGGGSGIGGDAGFSAFSSEGGQRFNLDPADDVHSFVLTVARKDKPEEIEEQVRQGGIVFNYGAFAVYRTQKYDIPEYYSQPNAAAGNPPANINQYVLRDANAGIGSLWGLFQWDKLKIEMEATGIVGLVNGTATNANNGLNSTDPDLTTTAGPQPLWVLQGGAALESSYSFLNDQLVVGLDTGIASGDDAFGFGLRPVVNQRPQAGDFDGKQYGECLETNDDGECTKVDDNITNFRFDPDYHVDLILFREILGTVTDAFYVKPHVGYYFTETLGVRGDVVYSHAIFASSTPGQQNPLGLELDGSAFYASDDGFYLMAQYGFLLPFGSFNHLQDTNGDPVAINGTTVDSRFANAQFAQTFQVFAGVQF